jgi:hypothetical protein
MAAPMQFSGRMTLAGLVSSRYYFLIMFIILLSTYDCPFAKRFRPIADRKFPIEEVSS